MTDSTNTGTQQGSERPWTAETFDAERAWNLVENLRGELATVKQALADEKTRTAELATVVSERDSLKATVEAQAKDLVTASKEKILRDRGLPTNLIATLQGDDERAWTEIADMLKSLKGTGGGEPGSKPSGSETPPAPQPDPFQQANNPGLTEDAQRMAIAKQVFG